MVWTGGTTSFEELTARAAEAHTTCGLHRLYQTPMLQNTGKRHLKQQAVLQALAKAKRRGRGLLRRSRRLAETTTTPTPWANCTVPPVVYQSFYHLHMARWLPLGRRLHIEYFDELERNASGYMARVGAFLQLPTFAFNVSNAYNVEGHRGANFGLSDNFVLLDDGVVTTAMSDTDASRLSLLFSDTIAKTHEQLTRDGREGLPAAWRVGVSG